MTRRVDQALRAADRGEAYHWPTIAAILAAEVRRLRSLLPPEAPALREQVLHAVQGEHGDSYVRIEDAEEIADAIMRLPLLTAATGPEEQS